MRAPLSVKLNDGTTDRLVSHYTEDLRFTKVAPGGHHSASMKIRLPRDDFPKLGPADSVYIYDRRTGNTVWDGYTENPGALDGPGGQGFDLTAMGGTVLASDESQVLVYRDADLGAWERVENSAASATTDASKDPSGSVANDGLLCQFTPGQPITTGSQANIAYAALADAGLEFGAMTMNVLDGKTDANYSPELLWSPSAGSVTLGAFNSNDTAFSKYVGDASSPTSGAQTISLRLRRTAGGATNIADDNTWVFFYNIAVLQRRMDRSGTLLTGVADHVTADYVLASWVAEDLLGRALTLCDPATAVIDTSTAHIDQLAYLDGATAAQVFDDMALHEPDFYWGIGERLPNGLHRFWFRAWPSSVRYEISVKDGYDAPGADVDLCNRISVYWTDANGLKHTTVRTSTVPELGARTKDAESVTLPEGRGSQTNAERIGDAVLAAKATASKAATATVDRPIMDLMLAKEVMPWELEPGCLVRVRETGDEMRLTEMEYVDVDCASTLTLGEPTLSLEQRVARLEVVA